MTDRDRLQIERYRRATEDTLQQLDWCIGYLTGIGKNRISGTLARNRQYIRQNLLSRDGEPVPTQDE